MTAGRGLRVEAGLVAGSSVLATGLAGLASIAVARGLGVEGRGTWAVVSATAVLTATVAQLGLPEAAAYGVARARGSDRVAVAAATGAASVVLAIAAAGVAAVAIALQDDSGGAGAVAAGAAVAAVAVVLPWTLRLVQVVGLARAYAVATIVAPALMLVVAAALALADELTVARVGAASAATALVAAVLGVSALHRASVLELRRPRPREALARLRPLVGFSVLTFATLALTHVVQRVDVLLVNGYRGSRDAGLYAVAVQFADLLLVVPAALGIVAFRRGASGGEAHWADFLRLVRWSAACAAATAGVLVLCAGWAVPFLVGDEYEGAVDAARLLAPGVAILGVQSVVSHYVASRGRPGTVVVAWAAGAVLTVAGNVWAIPRHGIEGAAIVSSLAYAVVLGLHVVAARRVRDSDRRTP